jgi:hypothetical protein
VIRKDNSLKNSFVLDVANDICRDYMLHRKIYEKSMSEFGKIYEKMYINPA